MPGEPRGPERTAPRRARATPRTSPEGMSIRGARGTRKRVWLLVSAAVLVAAGLLAMGRLAVEAILATSAVVPRAVAAEPSHAAPAPRVHAVPRASRAAPALAPPASEAEPVGSEEPDYTIDPPGSPPSGIALFPPPGTDPPKRGIIVPDDAVLPEGYVRHYQATDDGKPLAPILMFHPDYEWVDEQGAVVDLPESRVVPPELAPPGLPIEMLELPDIEVDRPGVR